MTVTETVPEQYICMPRPKLENGPFTVEALQPEHIEPVRQWRNAQMDVLRQREIITPEQQKTYYANHVWPDMLSPYPQNILLAYKENGQFIGYGGLVHIVWEHRRAEVSFLLETSIAGTPKDYWHHFPIFLGLMKELAFRDLGFERLSTETYAIRDRYISTLEHMGFQREGELRNNVRIQGRPVDSILHGCLRSSFWAEQSRVGGRAGNVLVTSASKKIPLLRAIQKSARKLDPAIKVIAGDSAEHALARYVANDFWRMPSTEEAVLDDLVAGCEKREITTVIPTRDGELLFWARHRERFARSGISVVISPIESIEICLDKLAFAQYGTANGMPFISAALHPDEIGEGPYVVKERFGAGARSIGLNLDRNAALTHGGKLENPIYQPFISGREISVDAWLDCSHQVKGLVLRGRELVVDGESQVTTTFRDSDMQAVVTKALQALKLRGPVVMQVLVDDQGAIHIIECNTRFGGASTLSVAVGLDVFYWSLLEGRGENLRDYPFVRKPGEVRQVRVPSDIYIHGSDF